MPTERTGSRQFRERWSERGHYYFSLTQVDNRFALCKACLLYNNSVYLKFKGIYDTYLEIEKYAITDYTDLDQLTARYKYIDTFGYGGVHKKYDRSYCPEGALFPFIRSRARSRVDLIDTGCIWLGTRFEYPRIYVENKVATWVSGYSPGGFPRTDPFLPYDKIRDVLPKLMNKSYHSDLDIQHFV